jgi:DNA invertase Pin-like site-specific DNA recombinase
MRGSYSTVGKAPTKSKPSTTENGVERGMPDGEYRLAIYARSASETSSHPASHVSTQIAERSALCEQRGWKVVICYADRATSGLSTVRKGLEDLLRDAETRPRPFDIVLVRDPSRIARSIPVWLATAEKLKACGLRVRTSDQLAHTREYEQSSCQIGETVLPIYDSLAKQQRR